MPKEEIDKKVQREAAEILDITQYLDRKPKALSQPAPAYRRAIVRDPQVFLMDEPRCPTWTPSCPQPDARGDHQAAPAHQHHLHLRHPARRGHDLGDRIVIMKDGFIQQIGTPREVFDQPANLFVVSFIGSPQMNFFDGELEKKQVPAQGGRQCWAARPRSC